jgi:hypothetical protein
LSYRADPLDSGDDHNVAQLDRAYDVAEHNDIYQFRSLV